MANPYGFEFKASLRKADPAKVQALVNEFGIRTSLASCLVGRGIDDPEQASAFLNPSLDDLHDPALLPDYTPARDILLGAIESKKPILINGDYDADGVTSTALLTRSLTRMGADVRPTVPQRSDGFGISAEAVKEGHKQGAKVLLSCDCGSSSLHSVAVAKELGMQVVVTDHHLPDDELPAADAIVNPNLDSSTYPWRGLSGAGVAFKLMYGLATEKGFGPQFLRKYVDLAAIGTIADVMPLRDENRIIAVHGVPAVIESSKPGLSALLQMADATKKMKAGSRRGWGRLISFVIAPRLNSGGRVSDSRIAMNLLLTADPKEAAELALELERLNAERKGEQAEIVRAAMERITEPPLFIVEGDESWNPGIVGIAASKIAETYHRPAFILGGDQINGGMKGSMRTIHLIHAKEVIDHLPHLLSGGGHAVAAGASLLTGTIDELRAAINAFAAEKIDPARLVPQYEADFEADLNRFSIDDVQQLEMLEPFGGANEAPTALIQNAVLTGVKVMGAERNHIKLTVKGENGGTGEVVSWGTADLYQDLQTGKRISMIAKPSVNEFNGKSSVQWQLEALQTY